ncbi:hypothetical protein FRC12_015192 [Ceratobasidium sp. 428]|nr:hypothetical protein FRC12_015192 [Ceratobasidium sp. 428]
MAASPVPDEIFERLLDLVKLQDSGVGNMLHGPEIDPHFVTFDPQQVVIPAAEVGFFHRYSGIMPAEMLRGYLLSWSTTDGDQRPAEELKFNDMVGTLSHYARLISGNGREPYHIFKHYYGLLSVRSMVHFTCVTILKATNTLAGARKRIKPSMKLDDAFDLCASAALDEATKAVVNPSSWKHFCGIFSSAQFISDGRNRAAYVEVAIKLLSLSRESLYTLYTRGLLPGCSLMLLAISAALPKDANVSDVYQGLHALEDLGFRLYLGGSLRDRQILQPMCMAVIERKHWMPDKNRLISTQDNAVICRAYCELLGAWRRDSINTKTIPVEFLTNMASLVLGLSLSDPKFTMRERIDIARTCVDMLWLIFEDGRRVPLSAHNALRNYAGAVVSYFRSFKKDLSNEEEHYLAGVLMGTDFIALYGRIFLLMTKGDDSHSSDYSFIFMADMLDKLEHLMNELQQVSLPLYQDWITQLGRVTAQFVSWLEMEGMERHKNNAEMQVAAHLCRSLAMLTNQKAEPEMLQTCAYPRCWRVDAQQYLLKPRHMCGKCNLVMYCDVYCQRAHWLLKTWDSHKNQCMRQ